MRKKWDAASTSAQCLGELLPGSCPRRWNECVMNGKDWAAVEKIHEAYAEEKRYWPDSSVRAKCWRAKQGKAVATYLHLHPRMVKALHEEAKRKSKAVWKFLRSCVTYGFSQAQRRGW